MALLYFTYGENVGDDGYNKNKTEHKKNSYRQSELA